jgi:hypothetical protein
MFWMMLAVSLALWIIQFGFGVSAWYVPLLNALLWVVYFVQLGRKQAEPVKHAGKI